MNVEITEKFGRVSTVTVDGVTTYQDTFASRQVFICEELGIVIKFDSERHTGRQNERELRNFKKIAKEDEKYFARIIETGKVNGRLYIIQEYVENTHRADVKTASDIMDLAFKYRIYDFFVSKQDNGHNNVSINKEGWKFYDLGWEREML